MARLIEQIQSSDLSRNPLKVFTAAEKNPVTVTRRDGEDLVLMNKKETENLGEFHVFIAQILSVLDEPNGSLVDRMSKLFPWMLAMESESQIRCARELLRTAKASLATDVPALALNELYSWKATAEAIAMGFELEEINLLNSPIPLTRP